MNEAALATIIKQGVFMHTTSITEILASLEAGAEAVSQWDAGDDEGNTHNLRFMVVLRSIADGIGRLPKSHKELLLRLVNQDLIIR